MRLEDDQYYEERDVEHAAQGDVYDNIPFAYETLTESRFRSRGARKRPASVTPLTGLAVVCNYTCGFVAQPPGNPGYSHPFRLVAPILSLRTLRSQGMSANELRRIRDDGGVNGLMYLPLPPGVEEAEDDEWTGHAAACLYRMTTVTQTVLDERPRVARLSEAAQRILIVRLIQVVSPALFEDPNVDQFRPDMSDSWRTVERR